MIVYLDGRLVAAEQAAISIDDRGFLAADGVFETALVHGGGFFRLEQHLDRFAASAALLRLTPPSHAELRDIACALVRANGLEDAALRFTLTRGAARPALLVTARPPDAAWIRRAAAGWRVITARTRRPATSALPAQLKCIGRTHALLARIEATDAGVDGALLLNQDGQVCEGPAWNIFWRSGATLRTPALEAGVLAGITRGVLLDAAAAAGLRAEEGLYDVSDVAAADEIFASMTSVGIVSIHEFDGVPVRGPAHAAGLLRQAYLRTVRSEAAADPVGSGRA